MKSQQEDGCLKAKERGLRSNNEKSKFGDYRALDKKLNKRNL